MTRLRLNRAYILLLVYGVSLLLCLFALTGCAVLRDMFLGAGTGAAATKDINGAALGAVVGFVIGVWDTAVATISSWWNSLFGPKVITEQGPSVRHEIWQWIILFVVAIAIVKFVYHYVFDADFRGHVHGFFKPKLPKRKSNATSAS